MTDRKLLELAAKAAGHDIPGIRWDDVAAEYVNWNPLTDDGDALRLAVSIEMLDISYSNEDWDVCNHDGYAATRRAIVRAAAAIGEAMP